VAFKRAVEPGGSYVVDIIIEEDRIIIIKFSIAEI